MINLEEMSAKELTNLKVNIDNEIEKRKRLNYDKLLEKFSNVLYELYENFPNEYCLDGETWEELVENHNWEF